MIAMVITKEIVQVVHLTLLLHAFSYLKNNSTSTFVQTKESTFHFLFPSQFLIQFLNISPPIYTIFRECLGGPSITVGVPELF